MSKNKKLEKQMKNFLKALDAKESIDYSDETIRRCVYECHKLGYVAGFPFVDFSLTGKILFDISPNPSVTKAGYEFLEKHPDWISIFTLIASLVTAIGVLVQLILQIAGS